MTAGNRFYEEELSYLIEAGREYARVHPERARALDSCKPTNSRAIIKMTTANAAGNTSPSSPLVFLRNARPDG